MIKPNQNTLLIVSELNHTCIYIIVVLKGNTYKGDIMTKEKGRKYDGKSRPPNELYSKRWQEIFGSKKEEEDNGSTEEADRTTD